MKMEAVLSDVDELLRRVQEQRTHLAEDISTGLKWGDELRAAAREVGESSSGSWVGWHSRMYYANYREPPVADSWDSEWGGIHGFSSSWHERSLADVQREIENRAGTTLASVAQVADRIRNSCQPLQSEVLTVLSPVCDLAGLAKEAGLLEQLEQGKWIISPSEFVRAMAPSAISSRDSHALSQGLQPPLHVNVEAAIVSNTSTIAKGRDFLDQALRLTRQVRMKLKSAPMQGDMVATGSADVDLLRKLRLRSIGLFLVLAIALVGAAVLLLDRVVNHRLVGATIIVGTALLISAIYAVLFNRRHASRVLAIAAAIGGAIAAFDQLLGHFYS